jgi:hypothetical protein
MTTVDDQWYEALEAARRAGRRGEFGTALDIYDRLVPEPGRDGAPGPGGLAPDEFAAVPQAVRQYVDPVLSICRRLPGGMSRSFIRIDLGKGDIAGALAGLADVCRSHLSALAMQRASTAQKVAAFQRIRLRGRPVPEDLHRLLVAYWEDHPTLARVFRRWELEILDPYEGSWLEDLVEAGSDAVGPDPVDPKSIDAAAYDAGYREVARHTAVLGAWQNNSLFGYWWHPDEPGEPWPPVVQIDSEGEISVIARDCSLVEALVGGSVEENEAHFDQLAAILRDAGIAVEKRGQYRSRYGHNPDLTVDPETLCEAVRGREAARLTAAAQIAVQQARSSPGPGLETLLGVLGRPTDHSAVVGLLAELDLETTVPFGREDISRNIAAPERGIEITFQRADEIRDERRFGVPADDPITSVITMRADAYAGALPHDLRFDQSRAEVHDLLGPPLRVRYDGDEFWQIDRRFVRISYATAGTVESVAVGLPWKGFP